MYPKVFGLMHHNICDLLSGDWAKVKGNMCVKEM